MNAHVNIVGYILLIRRLYQLKKSLLRPRNNVYPEQKKNNASPTAPPVASTVYLPYNKS